MTRARIVRATIVAALLLAVALPAHAADPVSHDDRSAAAKIDSLPAVSLIWGTKTVEAGEDTSCDPGQGTVWYAYRSPVAQTITARFTAPEALGGGSPNPTVHVYRKDRNVTTSVGCGPLVEWTAEPGAHYLLQVTGDFWILRVNGSAQPTAKIEGAERIVGPTPFYEFAGIGTRPAPGEPKPSCAETFNGTPWLDFGTRWYTYTADAVRLLDVTVEGADPLFLSVYARGLDGTMQESHCSATLEGFRTAGATVTLLPGETVWYQMGFNASPEAEQTFNFFPMIFEMKDLGT